MRVFFACLVAAFALIVAPRAGMAQPAVTIPPTDGCPALTLPEHAIDDTTPRPQFNAAWNKIEAWGQSAPVKAWRRCRTDAAKALERAVVPLQATKFLRLCEYTAGATQAQRLEASWRAQIDAVNTGVYQAPKSISDGMCPHNPVMDAYQPSAPPSACPAFPAAPALPTWNTATREQMAAANTLYAAWTKSFSSTASCRDAEIRKMHAAIEADPNLPRYNESTRRYAEDFRRMREHFRAFDEWVFNHSDIMQSR